MVKQKISDRIKELRAALGLSQTEFAYQTGISHSLLTKIESGDNEPTNKVLTKIKEKWGVADQWLVAGKGELTYKRGGSEPWKDEAWELAKKQIEKKDEQIETKDRTLEMFAKSLERLTRNLGDGGLSFLHPVKEAV